MLSEATLARILTDAWAGAPDPAHDIGHIKRVVASCKAIAAIEGGDLDVLVPAAWLHDIVNLPKDSPQRAQASSMAADAACSKLRSHSLPDSILAGIHHAICAHSFSANIPATTIEAKILQDADRLDALGAIGIARCFAVSGILGRTLFDTADPLAQARAPDDSVYGLDHFAVKLYKIAETLQTPAARNMAATRIAFMRSFAEQIATENAA